MLLCIAGRQYDKFGNMVDWWGNQSKTQFKDLAQCFVDEYTQFTVYGHHVCLSVRLCNTIIVYTAFSTLMLVG